MRANILYALIAGTMAFLSGCGTNSGGRNNGLNQNAYQNQYQNNNPNVMSVPGPYVANCQPNEVRLGGTCMGRTDLPGACRSRSGTFIPTSSSNQNAGICRMVRRIMYPRWVTTQISMGLANNQMGCRNGASDLCTTQVLKPLEALVAYGTIRKSNAAVAWQLEMYQNGNFLMGSAQGGYDPFSGTAASNQATPVRKNKNGECLNQDGSVGDCGQNVSTNGGLDDNFVLQGSPNVVPGVAVNGNPNFAQSMAAAQGTASTYELRLTTGQSAAPGTRAKLFSSLKVYVGFSAISCEDGFGRYVPCPVAGSENTVQR